MPLEALFKKRNITTRMFQNLTHAYLKLKSNSVTDIISKNNKYSNISFNMNAMQTAIAIYKLNKVLYLNAFLCCCKNNNKLKKKTIASAKCKLLKFLSCPPFMNNEPHSPVCCMFCGDKDKKTC